MNITFVANQSFEFIDPDFETKGVGGSEYALILLTRTLAKRGHRISVFGRSKNEGAFNGVQYLNISKFDSEKSYEVLVLFRCAHLWFTLAKAKRKIFWDTDVVYDCSNWDNLVFPYVDKIICISPFQRQFLLNHFKHVKPRQLELLDHGVIREDYFDAPPEVIPRKAGNRLIYCSVPERGLAHLARLFPLIKERVSDAELVITSDYSLWGRETGNQEYKEMLANTNGVSFLGKISRRRLVELQKSSKVMAYPCNYLEGFCIAALECIAAGAVPVTTNSYALTTTVADNGVLIDGNPGEVAYDAVFVNSIVTLLEDGEYWRDFALKGRQRALSNYTWESIAKRFEEIVIS